MIAVWLSGCREGGLYGAKMRHRARRGIPMGLRTPARAATRLVRWEIQFQPERHPFLPLGLRATVASATRIAQFIVTPGMRSPTIYGSPTARSNMQRYSRRTPCFRHRCSPRCDTVIMRRRCHRRWPAAAVCADPFTGFTPVQAVPECGSETAPASSSAHRASTHVLPFTLTLDRTQIRPYDRSLPHNHIQGPDSSQAVHVRRNLELQLQLCPRADAHAAASSDGLQPPAVHVSRAKPCPTTAPRLSDHVHGFSCLLTFTSVITKRTGVSECMSYIHRYQTTKIGRAHV